MDFNHGTAKLKKNIIVKDMIVHRIDEEGIITAFLPNEQVYAVMFDGLTDPKNWFVFHDLKTFNEYFNYTLKD